MIAWFIHIAFAIVSIIFCAIAPAGFDSHLCQTIAACYCVQTLLYFLFNGKKNFVGFEFFFCIAFFFANFAYPLFYYPDHENWMFFFYPWNRAVITRATAIAYLGYTFFMLGITRWVKMDRKEPIKVEFSVSMNQYLILFILTVASFALYVYFGGWAAMRAVYNGSGSLRDVGIYSYIYVIFTLCIYLMAIFVFHLRQAQWWFYLLTMGVCIILILATGSRTVVLAIGLILIVGWNNNVRRFKVWEILIVTLVGVFSLWLIMQTRKEGNNSVMDIIHSMKPSEFVDIFADLTINGMNLYILVDYGMKHTADLFNGMLIDLATPIPGMAKYIVAWTGRPYETLSAQEMSTYIMLGENSSWGMGCNMIGDAFRAGKYIGVALSMFLIGSFVKASYYRSRTNIYWYAVYYLLVSYAVFYVRGPILFPLRVLCWTLLLLWGVRSLTTFDWNKLFGLKQPDSSDKNEPS